MKQMRGAGERAAATVAAAAAAAAVACMRENSFLRSSMDVTWYEA
jgi:hypothetical protein